MQQSPHLLGSPGATSSHLPTDEAFRLSDDQTLRSAVCLEEITVHPHRMFNITGHSILLDADVRTAVTPAPGVFQVNGRPESQIYK